MTKDLTTLVREYFAAKARYADWGPARNLQVKGAARQKAHAKAKREFNAADDALRAAVGVDGFGVPLKKEPVKHDVLTCADSPTGKHEFSHDEEYAQKHHVDATTLPRSCEHCGEEEPS